MKVFVKFFTTLGYYSICHAKSGQNAFRSEINRFATLELAENFCLKNKCEIIDINTKGVDWGNALE